MKIWIILIPFPVFFHTYLRNINFSWNIRLERLFFLESEIFLWSLPTLLWIYIVARCDLFASGKYLMRLFSSFVIHFDLFVMSNRKILKSINTFSLES